MSKSRRFSALVLMLLLNATTWMTAVGPVPVKAAVQPDWLPVPREESVIFYGELTYTTYDNFNPLVASVWSSTYHVGPVVGVWEAPFYLNYATGDIIYWLCTGWEYSNNFTTFTMHLRRGVTWSDGHPFTAEDMVFDVEIRRLNPAISGYSWAKSINVSAVDDYTFQVKLPAPDPRFHYNYQGRLMMMPKHIWKNVTDPLTYRYYPPIGTGPYKLYNVYPDLGLFVWERRNDYWGITRGYFPAAKYMVWRRAPPADAMLEDFVRGYVDAFGSYYSQFMPLDTLAQAILRNPNATILPVPAGGPWTFVINTDKYPLNITAVRWAISYAIDRDTLSRLSPSLTPPGAALFPWGNWPSANKYVYPDVFERYKLEYNVTKANEILDALGYARGGDGIRVTPNGTRLSFTIINCGEPGDYLALLGDELVIALAKIGIEAENKLLEWGVYYDRHIRGQFDISVCWISGGVVTNNDPLPLLSSFHSKYYAPINEKTLGGNWERTPSRFRNHELDQIVDQATAMSPDDPETQVLYKRGIEILMRELPVIPVTHRTMTFLWSQTYWKNWPTTENFYAWPTTWWANFLFVLLGIQSTKVQAPIVPPEILKNIATLNATLGGLMTSIEALINQANLLTGQTSQLNNRVTNMASDVASLKNSVAALSAELDTLTLTATIEAVIIVVLAVILLVTLRKK